MIEHGEISVRLKQTPLTSAVSPTPLKILTVIWGAVILVMFSLAMSSAMWYSDSVSAFTGNIDKVFVL